MSVEIAIVSGSSTNGSHSISTARRGQSIH
jgi:hypothetical protein